MSESTTDDTPIMEDRPAGPKDKVLENGLVYGRWYGGALQPCGCHTLPEGMHSPSCERGLCTTKRAEPEAMELAEEADEAT